MTQETQEVWHEVKDFEGLYQVSNLGRVQSLERQVFHGGNKKLHNIRGKVLKPRVNNCGYVQVRLYKDGKCYTKSVHRLLGEATIPNTENKCCIDHIDGKKTNNIQENLRWLTHSENMRHAYSLGLINSSTRNNIRKHPINQKENGINQ